MPCLRFWCSEWYQRISLLLHSFQAPLCPSSITVSTARPRLSRGILQQTYYTADRYALRPIIPDNARGLCITAAAGTELATSYSSPTVRNSSVIKAVYNPKAFIPHAASLDQGFPHCPKFPTAASRRSRGRVAVPVWRVILSDPLPVIGLVSRYLTNYLMGRRPRLKHLSVLSLRTHPVLARLSASYPELEGSTHVLLSRSPLSHLAALAAPNQNVNIKMQNYRVPSGQCVINHREAIHKFYTLIFKLYI